MQYINETQYAERKACWENTGSFKSCLEVSIIYGIFIVMLHGNMQVPAVFLLDPLLLSGRYQCKCSDYAIYTFCNLLLAVRLKSLKINYFIFYILKNKLH